MSEVFKIEDFVSNDKVGELKQKLIKLVDECEDILYIDLSVTKLLCSSALGLFIAVLKKLKAKEKKLILIIPDENTEMKQLFRITNLIKIFEIVERV